MAETNSTQPIKPGQQFGRLTVLEKTRYATHKWGWLCKCVCGTHTTVLPWCLARGYTKSCGCLARDLKIARLFKHGARKAKVPEYRIWMAMRERCNRTNGPQFSNYGGRGIKVCARWNSFRAFLKDMGTRPTPHHSIDRINNELGYGPDNCRWATSQEQANNTRYNRHLTFQGRTQTMAQWSRETGLTSPRICNRLKQGWSIERTLSTPATQSRRRATKS